MNKLKTLSECLKLMASNIDSGNSNLNETQCDELLSMISTMTVAEAKYSIYQACKYLGISRATFDRYVKDGIIPEGRRQQGFKELFYLKKDLDYAKHQIMDNCRSGNSNYRTNRNN